MAGSFHANGPRSHDDPDGGHRPVDIAALFPDGELDRRIQAGWEEWCELLEALIKTEGMLPPQRLVTQVLSFFDNGYWEAEDARIEALRRRFRTDADRCRQRPRGLHGR